MVNQFLTLSMIQTSKHIKYGLLFLVINLWFGCNSENQTDDFDPTYTPLSVDLEIPELFDRNLIDPLIPSDNPLTAEGIALGKKLFFDPILSSDNTISCASCHNPSNAFSDTSNVSQGFNGQLGLRNAMPLFNLAWNFDELFAWDGKEFSLERQVAEPITSEIEMNNTWENVVNALQNHEEYPTLFEQAFGAVQIDQELITKAISQFERTLISGNSKFDQFLLGQVELTESEQNGFNVFLSEDKGDCFHCHGTGVNPLWTDNDFHNNGLDATFTDLGLGAITGDPNDNGKFKTPSIRNLAFTAPYMHDGRFTTLDEVINHYSEGLQFSSTIDPLMKEVAQGGVQLTDQEKADLKDFLLTLSDYDFINNPDFQE